MKIEILVNIVPCIFNKFANIVQLVVVLSKACTFKLKKNSNKIIVVSFDYVNNELFKDKKNMKTLTYV